MLLYWLLVVLLAISGNLTGDGQSVHLVVGSCHSGHAVSIESMFIGLIFLCRAALKKSVNESNAEAGTGADESYGADHEVIENKLNMRRCAVAPWHKDIGISLL